MGRLTVNGSRSRSSSSSSLSLHHSVTVSSNNTHSHRISNRSSVSSSSSHHRSRLVLLQKKAAATNTTNGIVMNHPHPQYAHPPNTGGSSTMGCSSPTSNSSSWTEWMMDTSCGADLVLGACNKNQLHNHFHPNKNGGMPYHYHQNSLHNAGKQQFTLYEEDERGSAITAARMLLLNLDYAALHDELLESLLSQSQSERSMTVTVPEEDKNNSTNCNVSVSVPIPGEDHHDGSFDEQSLSTGPLPRKRRRPALQQKSSSLSKSNDSSSVAATTITTTTTSTPVLETAESTDLSLDHENIHNNTTTNDDHPTLPDPVAYIHPLCRMQKDKGRGEAVGSMICAKGRDACLEKLRVKMRLLTDVVQFDPLPLPLPPHPSIGSNSSVVTVATTTTSTTATPTIHPPKGAATLKRKRAKVVKVYDNFTETRSLIEIKMGFMSMTYGVLLRWDTQATGLVTLVVLRKMCHDSFYNTSTVTMTTNQQQPLLFRSSSSAASVASYSVSTATSVFSSSSLLQEEDDPTVEENSVDHASLQLSSSPPPPIRQQQQASHLHHHHHPSYLPPQEGMEVTLLEPPFCVAPPVHHPSCWAPSFLHAQVLHASGLNRKCHYWTIKLVYDNNKASVNVLLTWNAEKRCFLPRRHRHRPYNDDGELDHYNDDDHGVRDMKNEPSDVAAAVAATLKYTLPPMSATLSSPLTIKLYEHFLRHRNYRRLISTFHVPLTHLQPQRCTVSSAFSSCTELMRLLVPIPLPRKHHYGEDATIALGLAFGSDYGYWLQQELEARRKQYHHLQLCGGSEHLLSSKKSSVSRRSRNRFASFLYPSLTPSSSPLEQHRQHLHHPYHHQEHYEKENNSNGYDLWDWICCIC